MVKQFYSIHGWDPISVTTTPGQSRPESNGTERVLHIPQSSRTEASLSDGLVSYPGHLEWEVLPFCRDAVSVFYSSSQLGCIISSIR